MGDWVIVEILVALLAGLVGGVLSRWIPLPRKAPYIEPVSGPHTYEVRRGDEVLYLGSDLRIAKVRRHDNPGSVLIADGVNRG